MELKIIIALMLGWASTLLWVFVFGIASFKGLDRIYLHFPFNEQYAEFFLSIVMLVYILGVTVYYIRKYRNEPLPYVVY